MNNYNDTTERLKDFAIRATWMIAAVLLVFFIKSEVESGYEWDKQFGSHWSLADKASTLDGKLLYLDKFVSALENSGLKGTYNATRLKTADNSFDANFNALKTLQARLKDAQALDSTSLTYQQAISQITAQEWNEAEDMIGVFYGCWKLQNYPLLWGWHGLLLWSCIFALLVFFALAEMCR